MLSVDDLNGRKTSEQTLASMDGGKRLSAYIVIEREESSVVVHTVRDGNAALVCHNTNLQQAVNAYNKLEPRV